MQAKWSRTQNLSFEKKSSILQTRKQNLRKIPHWVTGREHLSPYPNFGTFSSVPEPPKLSCSSKSESIGKGGPAGVIRASWVGTGILYVHPNLQVVPMRLTKPLSFGSFLHAYLPHQMLSW